MLPYAGSNFDRGSVFKVARYNFLHNVPGTAAGTMQPGESNLDYTSYDHSRPLSRDGGIDVTFTPSSGPIDYVFISGHNLYNGTFSTGAATVTIMSGSTVVGVYTVKGPGNLFLTFSTRSFPSGLRIIANNNLATSGENIHTISCIMAGRHSTFYQGVQSGFEYLTLSSQTKSKTQTNEYAAPTSSLTSYESKKGSFSIANVAADELWRLQDHIAMAKLGVMCVKEIVDRDDSGVLCSDCTFSYKAHASTTKLFTYTFSYNGFIGF